MKIDPTDEFHVREMLYRISAEELTQTLQSFKNMALKTCNGSEPLPAVER